MRRIKNIILNITYFFSNLMHALHRTDTEVFGQVDNGSDAEAGQHEIKTTGRLSESLLKGELTEEVKELVWRTYKVERESKEWLYISPTKGIKKSDLAKKEKEFKGDEEALTTLYEIQGIDPIKKKNKFLNYENSENLEVIVVQDNYTEQDSVEDEIKHLGQRMDVFYTIKIERNFMPRFRLEEFATKIVVRKFDERWVLLDIYVSSYAQPDKHYPQGFKKEIEKIRDKGWRSDVVDFETLHFVTRNAMLQKDWLEYSFDNINFKNITELDGSYVLHFKARMVKDGYDIVEKYRSDSMEEKYANKAPKQRDLNILEARYAQIERYVCESCGKEMVWDNAQIDLIPQRPARYVEDEKEDIPEVLEFLDAEISLATVGKVLCKECLAKYLEEELRKEENKQEKTKNNE